MTPRPFCDTCGGPFECRIMDRYGNEFCSVDCHYYYRRPRRWPWALIVGLGLSILVIS